MLEMVPAGFIDIRGFTDDLAVILGESKKHLKTVTMFVHIFGRAIHGKVVGQSVGMYIR